MRAQLYGGLVGLAFIYMLFTMAMLSGASVADDPETTHAEGVANMTDAFDTARENTSANMTGVWAVAYGSTAQPITYAAEYAAYAGYHVGHFSPLLATINSVASRLVLLGFVWAGINREKRRFRTALAS